MDFDDFNDLYTPDIGNVNMDDEIDPVTITGDIDLGDIELSTNEMIDKYNTLVNIRNKMTNIDLYINFLNRQINQVNPLFKQIIGSLEGEIAMQNIAKNKLRKERADIVIGYFHIY